MVRPFVGAVEGLTVLMSFGSVVMYVSGGTMGNV